MKRAHILEEDLIPEVKGPPKKTYRVRWSRKALGRFVTEQMIARGYFVRREVITGRQGRGRYESETAIRGRGGKVYRGFWADGKLADAAEVSESTVEKLRRGGHLRSPFFFTVLKVLRALGLEIVLAPSDDTDVAFLAKGW